MARYNQSNQAGKTDTVTHSESQSYTPTQKKYFDKLLREFGSTDGSNIFEGDRVADLGELQKSAYGQAGGFMDYFSPDRGMPLYEETGDALAGILRGEGGADQLSLDEANQRYNEAYVDPAMRTFGKYTAPTIKEEYAGPGFWGSARAGAVGSAASDLGAQLEARRSQYLWDTEGVNRGLQEAQAQRTQAGIGQGMQYGQQEMMNSIRALQGTQGLFAFGSQEQQQRQNEINADILQFAEQQHGMSQEDLSVMLSLLGMTYTTSTMDSETHSEDHSKSYGGSILWG
jgi:hypothetical protein